RTEYQHNPEYAAGYFHLHPACQKYHPVQAIWSGPHINEIIRNMLRRTDRSEKCVVAHLEYNLILRVLRDGCILQALHCHPERQQSLRVVKENRHRPVRQSGTVRSGQISAVDGCTSAHPLLLADESAHVAK